MGVYLINLGSDVQTMHFAFLLYQVEGVFYVNDALEKLMFEELRNACRGGGKYARDPCMGQVEPSLLPE